MAALFKTAFGAIFIALVSAVFAISFAAIIYAGDLAPYLDRGIALTLLGSLVVALTGALTLSYRGSILAPQDVPAILLSGAAATLIATGELSGDALFATVACMTAAASLATGLAGLIFGQLKLAYIARFVPFPVLAGFLAATGLLLLIGAIGVAIGNTAEGAGWAIYKTPDVLFKWLPPVLVAIAIVIATRLFKGHMTLPIALVAAIFSFYALFWTFGLSLSDASAKGLLLGPFKGGSFLTSIDPSIVNKADWGAILTQIPVILTIIATALMGNTLNASGLELAFRRDFDISREVKSTGLANILNACVGGLPAYHLLGESLLAHRLGLFGAIAGISSAIGCGLAFLFGAAVLQNLPLGFFAAVIAFLGLDLLYTWLWEERRRLKPHDYAIVLAIPIIAVSFGFLTAIAVGLMLASAIFVIGYAKLDMVRSESDLSVRRSFVERPDSDLAILAKTGDRVKIIELSGFLFFGSSNLLRERMQSLMDDTKTQLDWLVIDFGHVTGLDVSTLRVLARLANDCEKRGVHLILSGLSQNTRADLETEPDSTNHQIFNDLNGALGDLEETLLSQAATEEADSKRRLTQLETLLAQPALSPYAAPLHLDTDTLLFDRNARSKDIYVLQSGRLTVSVPGRDGLRVTLAEIRPGAVIGEMAYYSGQGRSADIHAAMPSDLIQLDMTQIDQLEQKNPEIAAQFHKLVARHMARRLSRTTQLLRDLGV